MGPWPSLAWTENVTALHDEVLDVLSTVGGVKSDMASGE